MGKTTPEMAGLKLKNHVIVLALVLGNRKVFIIGQDYGSVALHSHNSLKWSAILGLSFLCGAGGPGNPWYGVQARLVNFALHFQKC